MSEEHSSNPTDNNTKKGFFQSLLTNFFPAEPKNREELVEAIRDSEQNDIINQETRQMIEGVIEISELRVRDIMIPRSQIVFINAEQSLSECLDIIIESAHSRFPVIANDRDNVIGLLLAKDLLKYLRPDSAEFSIHEVLRPAVIIPESKRVDRMLKEFRSERFHMAIVVDEFGSISGLVTIEDILEEIFGEIDDEHDSYEYIEEVISDTEYRFSARLEIDYINDKYNIKLPVSEEYETIAGMILWYNQSIPKPGESTVIDGFKIEITEATTTKIEEVKLEIIRE